MKYTVLYLRIPSTPLSRHSLELYIPAFTTTEGFTAPIYYENRPPIFARKCYRNLREEYVRTCSLRPCISCRKLVAFSFLPAVRDVLLY